MTVIMNHPVQKPRMPQSAHSAMRSPTRRFTLSAFVVLYTFCWIGCLVLNAVLKYNSTIRRAREE